MKKISLLLFVCIVLYCGNVQAINLTETGAEVTIEYDEPITNIDGTPLKDLSYTTVYWDIKEDTLPAIKIKVPASSINGGGHIVQKITVPITNGMEADVWFWATATDNSPAQNESPCNTTNFNFCENEKKIRIDRLSPNLPK